MATAHRDDIEKIEISLFLDAIFQCYGYDFRNYAQASIRRRVRRILEKNRYASVSEMIPKLLHDEVFAAAVVQDFSVAVTEMFRDPDFYSSVRKNVIPFLKTYPFIKIWHAGCCTGEEVYSLAILLHEEDLYDRVTIFATDFNEAALEKAREGIYKLDDMRRYTESYKKADGNRSFSEYYHARYDFAILNESLKKNITFTNHNLVTDGVFGEMHLIFCRNVLIYFNKTLQKRVMTLFDESLGYGGFLCVGSKESIEFSTPAGYFKEIDGNARIYQKRAL
jgi:chemotaxis protein methyltransferase CheR